MVGVQWDALVHDLPSDGHPWVAGVQVLQGQRHILTPEPPPPLRPLAHPHALPSRGLACAFIAREQNCFGPSSENAHRALETLQWEQGRHLSLRHSILQITPWVCSLGPRGPSSEGGTCEIKLSSGDSIP